MPESAGAAVWGSTQLQLSFDLVVRAMSLRRNRQCWNIFLRSRVPQSPKPLHRSPATPCWSGRDGGEEEEDDDVHDDDDDGDDVDEGDAGDIGSDGDDDDDDDDDGVDGGGDDDVDDDGDDCVDDGGDDEDDDGVMT